MLSWMVHLAAITALAAASASAGQSPPSPADPDVVMQITMTSGEVLRGRIVAEDPELLVVEHAVLGRLEIPRWAVASLAPTEAGGAPAAAPEDPPPPVAATTAPPVALAPPVEAEIAEARRKIWQAQLELGASGTAGNKQDTDARFSLLATRTTELNILKLDSTYRFSTSRGDRRINDFTAGAHSEWPVPESRWSYFAQARYDYDEFVSWDYRVTAAGGVSYRLLDLKKINDKGESVDVLLLTVRAGAGVRREFGSEQDELDPEGLAGGALVWTISPRQKLIAESTAYPSFREPGEFRLVSSGSWVIDLDTLDGISLKVGVSHEYESRTDPGISHYDLAVYSALMIKF